MQCAREREAQGGEDVLIVTVESVRAAMKATISVQYELQLQHLNKPSRVHVFC